ncbi:MAG: hypothetical protein KDD65_02180 [Bacteroidetes bacterium]|nr:hypothetical protein [Bacteroidota bacterium]
MEESGHELHIAAEPEGLEVGPIVVMVTTRVILPIVAAVLLIFPIANRNVIRYEMEATVESGFPVKDNAEAEAATKLNNYRVVDRAAGVYQIPVDRAIDIMVAQEKQNADRRISNVLPK